MRRRAVLAAFCAGVVVVVTGATAGAVPPDPVNDGRGNEWRQLYETTNLTWEQVAQVCPRDGATPCSGSLTGWVWATAPQVVALLGNYAPDLLAAPTPTVSGPQYFLPAGFFLGDMRWTTYLALTYFSTERTAGWTASADDAGAPIEGVVANGFPPASGLFSVGAGGSATEASSARGVWLWRPAGVDHTPPAITPTVTGTAGNGGWYVSDVSVAWDVQDAESPVTDTTGCGSSTVGSDTAGSTFTCSATSIGGTASASTVVRRDTTPPALTCTSPTPSFELYRIGAWVTASVADATSGPASALASGPASTSKAGSFTTTVTGADSAGNTATTTCSYRVVVPTCGGLAPTIVGTASNDTIDGTNGRDVIVALGGADTVNARGGDDVVCGGDGPDALDGGDGNDVLDGGASSDSLRGGNGVDTCISGEARLSSCER